MQIHFFKLLKTISQQHLTIIFLTILVFIPITQEDPPSSIASVDNVFQRKAFFLSSTPSWVYITILIHFSTSSFPTTPSADRLFNLNPVFHFSAMYFELVV